MTGDLQCDWAMDFTQISVNMKDTSDLGLGCRIKLPNIANIVFAIVQTVVPGFMLSPEMSGCSGLHLGLVWCRLRGVRWAVIPCWKHFDSCDLAAQTKGWSGSVFIGKAEGWDPLLFSAKVQGLQELVQAMFDVILIRSCGEMGPMYLGWVFFTEKLEMSWQVRLCEHWCWGTWWFLVWWDGEGLET